MLNSVFRCTLVLPGVLNTHEGAFLVENTRFVLLILVTLF